MNVQIDLRVAELLASRLCHDLVGPIGAASNGLELMADDGEMSDEAMHLASHSAERAGTVLQFMRLAHGMAGSRLDGNLSDLRGLSARYLAKSKIELDWTPAEATVETPENLGKLLLNMMLLAEETLPRGGTLKVAVGNGPAGFRTSVTATGQGAGLREETGCALANDVSIDDLTPRNVQGYLTRLLARRLGADLVLDASAPDRVELSVSLPA